MIARRPATARLARFSRRLGLDRNPLRRRIDRAETWIMAGLLTALVAGAPLVSAGAGQAEHVAGVHAQRAQHAWQQVPAVLLRDAPSDGSFVYQSSSINWVRARWAAPDGSPKVGEVPVAGGKPAGSTVRVWVDRSGKLTGDPVNPALIADRTIAAEVFAPTGLTLLLICFAAVTHWLLQRRRLAAWQAEWATIEPQWSRRR